MFKKGLFFLILIAVIFGGVLLIQQQKNKPQSSPQQQRGVWCGKEKCFWFDGNGILAKAAPRPEGALVLVVNDPTIAYPQNPPLPKKFWQHLMTIINSPFLKQLTINRFTINHQKQEATAVGKKFNIFFSLKFDPTPNLKALQKTIAEGKINLNRIAYIDLRSENKIYFK